MSLTLWPRAARARALVKRTLRRAHASSAAEKLERKTETFQTFVKVTEQKSDTGGSRRATMDDLGELWSSFLTAVCVCKAVSERRRAGRRSWTLTLRRDFMLKRAFLRQASHSLRDS